MDTGRVSPLFFPPESISPTLGLAGAGTPSRQGSGRPDLRLQGRRARVPEGNWSACRLTHSTGLWVSAEVIEQGTKPQSMNSGEP